MASLLKRGKTYSLQDRLSGRLKRWSLRTDSLQIAKERLRQYESARLRGLDKRPAMIRVQSKMVGEESWEPKPRVNRGVPISTALQAWTTDTPSGACWPRGG